MLFTFSFQKLAGRLAVDNMLKDATNCHGAVRKPQLSSRARLVARRLKQRGTTVETINRAGQTSNIGDSTSSTGLLSG